MKSQSKLGVTIDSRCESIDLFLTPTRSDASSDATLYVSGITDVHPSWDTWEWQITDKYDIGTTFNEEPVWTTIYTGGVVRANSDDSVIRVKLTVGTCTYYSNVVGYDDPYVLPYKVYRALLSQSGTSAPTAVVLENTLGGAITFSYISPGLYNVNSAALFTPLKTFTTLSSGSAANTGLHYKTHAVTGTDSIVQILTSTDGGVASNNILQFVPLEILVYP